MSFDAGPGVDMLGSDEQESTPKAQAPGARTSGALRAATATQTEEPRTGEPRTAETPTGETLATQTSVLGRARRVLFITLGFVCLVIAAVGVVVPLLPTVDFLLLAAFCFDRGSPRLHAWLLSLPTVGPIIRDWEEHRVIRKRGKVMSVGAIALVFGYLVFFAKIRMVSRFLMAALGIGIVTFIMTRPSRRPDETSPSGAGPQS